jgi:2-polyprenyl-6-methoxyphenol hydroxylase-like FAD-dependent oxidoreductase
VIERASELRLGGQNIDVRGAGREVARRMGIEDDIRAGSTGEKGLRFVDRHGMTKAEFPAGSSDMDGFTAELEILRGDLVRILYDKTREGTEYIFGDYITGLREHDRGITASFAKGGARDFDLVIAADGIRSRTRSLAFGSEPEIRELGMYMAYLTIPRAASDDAWWYWYNAPGRRTIQLRPDNVGTTRALLSFMSEPRGYERLGVEEQRQLLRRVFSDAGWQAARVLAALDDSADVYFDAIGQVRVPQWSRGRVALVGDAGYCPSPISGMGTSLALAGPYVLAGEIAKHDNPGEAFAAYERIMRPYVRKAQQLPPGAPRLAHPQTKTGIAVFHVGVALAARLLASRFGNRRSAPPANPIDLPDYSAFVR